MVGTGRGAQLGHRDQGRRGARGDPARRHRGARQDRHHHRGPHGRWSTSVVAPGVDDADACCCVAGSAEDASEHPIARAVADRARARAAARSSPRPRSRTTPGQGVRGHRRRRRPSGSGRRRLGRRRCRRARSRSRRRRPRRPHDRVRGLGRRGARPRSSWPTRVKPTSRAAIDGAAPSSGIDDGDGHRRPRRRPPTRSPTRSASTGSSPRCSRARRSTSCARCRPRADGSRSSATA